MTATQVSDPASLAALFERDREVHIYGLADLEEPFWSDSTWLKDGDAAVGLVSTGDDWVTGYAMSRFAPEPTLHLLLEVSDRMPANTWVTGPLGMHDAVSTVRCSEGKGPHWRLMLDRLGDHDTHGAVDLHGDDLESLQDLHASDPDRSFFRPAMLGGMPFVGIWEGDRLVASAGCHVASDRYGVAAVGAVITRPSHRGRGLGAAVTHALCIRLVDRFRTVGLNVSASNAGALRMYERLGFRKSFQYEEVELL